MVVDNFLNRDVTRNLSDDFNNLFNNSFMRYNSFFHCLELNNFVDDFFDNSIYFDIDIFLDDNFLNAILNNRDLNDLFDFFDSFFDYDFGYNSLDYLRNLNYLLDNTRNNNNFFNYLLNLDNFRNLNHFLDDLFDRNLNLFDSIDMPQNFNDLFLDILDRLRNFDIVVDYFFYFNSLWLTDNDGIPDFNNDWNLPFNDLNDRLFNNLLNFHNSFMDDRNFDYSFYFLGDFFDCLDDLSLNLDNFFDSVNWDDLFNDNLYRIRLLDGVGDLYDLLNNLWNFNDSFFPLNDNNWLLNDPVDWDVSDLNMIFNLFSCNHFNFLDYLFHNFLNFNNFWYFNDLLDYLFDIDWNLYNLLHYFFDWNNFILVDDNLFNFGFNVIYNLSDGNRLLNLNDLLNDSLNFVNLRHFSDDFDDSVLHRRDLDGLFNDLFEVNHSVLCSWNNNWHFNWNWYFFLNFSDLFYFHNFFNNSFHWDNFRHFNDTVDNLFDNLLNFNNLGDHSEDLQNVVYVDNSHNLLVYHSDDTFIDFQSNASSPANLLKLFKKCLYKDSEVELNFSGFF